MTDPTDQHDVEREPPTGRWTVLLTASAVRTLDGLSPRVLPAVIEFVYGPLAENPLRVGKPLRGELSGAYSARRGGYRVLYDIEQDHHQVRVFRVATRSTAYRPR